MTAVLELTGPKPIRPIVDGRIVGGILDGDRPIGVRKDTRIVGFGIYVTCRSCMRPIAVREPSLAAAIDAGCQHLADVDHSPEAVRR